MLSHACASCGKLLDETSRTYSRDVRMWIARCPRCGFAVRWAPRAAREPARVWARLRALNLRLGLAVASLQLGSALMLFSVAYLDDLLRTAYAVYSLDDAIDFLAPSLITAALGGMLVGMCAATIAPFRRVYLTLVAAWAFTAAVVGAISLLLLLGEYGPAQFWSECADVPSRHARHSPVTMSVLGTAVLVSIAAAMAFGFSVRTVVRNAVRRAASGRRESLAPVRGAAQRPFGATP